MARPLIQNQYPGQTAGPPGLVAKAIVNGNTATFVAKTDLIASISHPNAGQYNIVLNASPLLVFGPPNLNTVCPALDYSAFSEPAIITGHISVPLNLQICIWKFCIFESERCCCINTNVCR